MKINKKIIAFFVVTLLALGLVLTLCSCGQKKYEIGVFAYRYDDSYITTVRTALQEKFAKHKGDLKVTFYNGEGIQATQTAQIEAAITAGTDLFVVNVVDNQSDAGVDIARKINDAGRRAVFFNREITNNALEVNGEFVYIGTDPNKPGYMIGELISDMIADKAEFDRYDRNGNGKLDYVMLRAEPGNPEADGRSRYSVEEANRLLKEKLGLSTNPLLIVGKEENAEWSSDKAEQKMAAFLTSNERDIDLVICNNDDMAIGAISALETKGYNKKGSRLENKTKYIPVFGVDALENAVTAINDGKMQGTIKQDGVAMAEAIVKLSLNIKNHKPLLDGTNYKFEQGAKKLRIPYSKIAAKRG